MKPISGFNVNSVICHGYITFEKFHRLIHLIVEYNRIRYVKLFFIHIFKEVWSKNSMKIEVFRKKYE